MLVLRLSRVGRKKSAAYRLLAQDSRRAPSGKFVAQLGHYNPHTKKAELKQAEIEQYLHLGAQPSSAVVKLLKEHKIKMPTWAKANLIVKNKAPKKQTDTAEAEGQSKPAEKSAEAAETEVAEADVQPTTAEVVENKDADGTPASDEGAKEEGAVAVAVEPTEVQAAKADKIDKKKDTDSKNSQAAAEE